MKTKTKSMMDNSYNAVTCWPREHEEEHDCGRGACGALKVAVVESVAQHHLVPRQQRQAQPAAEGVRLAVLVRVVGPRYLGARAEEQVEAERKADRDEAQDRGEVGRAERHAQHHAHQVSILLV